MSSAPLGEAIARGETEYRGSGIGGVRVWEGFVFSSLGTVLVRARACVAAYWGRFEALERKGRDRERGKSNAHLGFRGKRKKKCLPFSFRLLGLHIVGELGFRYILSRAYLLFGLSVQLI